MSAKQAKQGQQRLANLLAKRRLGLEKRALDIKAKKSGILTTPQRVSILDKIRNITDPEVLGGILSTTNDPIIELAIQKQLKDPNVIAEQAPNKGSVAATIREKG
jgi:hypothetical protein